ncbi:MAG: hypothetical protein GQ527_12675 [Bacteroidales bacterium]|nr:hypothetical protein [Bacteroidales bacterium]
MYKLRISFTTLVFSFLFIPILFSGNIKKNKYNPAFVRGMQSAHTANAAGFLNGGIAFPVKLGYSAFNPVKETNLPSLYDLRDLGMVPPVETQSAGGCWAYSSMSTIESRLLMMGEGLYDFSDNNLKYCHGFFDSRSTNGNAWMTTAYFARQSGPLLEAQDPHPGGTSQPGVNCPVDELPAFLIRDSRYPPGDMNTIKQLVMDVGSVWSLMYINLTYFNDIDNTYYYGGTHEVNHVLNIVGWDDQKVTAGGVGAWICQNTYGTGWGENGYVYMSYFDSQFLIYNAYYPSIEPYNDDSRVLLHDELGNYFSVGYGVDEGYALVKYEVEENLFVEKIGTYAMAFGTSIEMEVYSSFNEQSGELTGLLSTMSTQVCDHPGFYTFPLDAQFPAHAGDMLYVKVKYVTPMYEWPIPIEEYIATYADPVIESDVAWISENGQIGNWEKVGANTTDVFDLCINVYGSFNPVSIPIPNTLIIFIFMGLFFYVWIRK